MPPASLPVTPSAAHEKKLDAERTAIAKELNKKLIARLGKHWTAKALEDFFKDKLNTYEEGAAGRKK